MLGIGLGGFMDGFTKAQDFKLRQRRQEIADQQAKRQQTIDAREDIEYDRAVKQRDEITAINTGAKAEFDNRVAAGTEKPNNFDTFWTNYALPKLKNTYLAQGNMDMANKVQAWGESEDARAGAKLAMSALSKAQTGDIAGALADATSAGKRKGYLAHGYEIKGQDTIVDQSGKLHGYRLYMKGADGKDFQQDLPLDQVPKLIATYLNPEAAWQSQIASQADAAKRASDIADYRARKRIDEEYGLGVNKGQREDVIKELAKELDGGLSGTDKKFYDLPRDQQEELIRQRMELRTGSNQPGLNVSGQMQTPSASGRITIADKMTGRPVDPSTLRPRQSAPAQAPATGGAEPQNVPVPTPRPDQPASQPSQQRASPTVGTGRPRQGMRPQSISSVQDSSRSGTIRQILAYAEQALTDGQRPDAIAASLAENGVPEEQWPEALRRAAAEQRRGVFGLNVR